MKIISAVILYLLFFLLCFLGTGTDEKNIRSFYSYPDKIQDEIGKSGRIEIPKKKPYAVTFLSNTLAFTVVFAAVGFLTRENNFWYFFALGEGLNIFDLLVIDLLWWRHSKRVRFNGRGKPEDYLGVRKHIDSFLRAIPVFAAAAGLAAGLLKFGR